MEKRKGQSELIKPVAIMVFLLLVLGVMIGVDTVQANQLGVMEQFGKIKGIQNPGMKWTGIFTSVEKYDMRTKKVVVTLENESSAFDKTGQAIYATINVNYRIKNSEDTVMNLYSQVGKSRTVADKLNLNSIVTEGFKQATVDYEAMDILKKGQEVKELAKENIKRNFPTEYFVIQNIIITNIDFSDNFKNSIEEKKIAEQDAIKEEKKLEGVKFQQQQEIEKYKAEAEKMRLQKAEVSPLLNQQKWIEKWDGQLPTYMITDSESGNYILQIPTIEE